MTVRFSLLSIVVLLALGACAGTQREKDPSVQQTSAGAEELAIDAMLPRGLKLPFLSLAALEDIAGSAREIDRQPFENQHVLGQIDHVVTYRFDGFEADVYEYPDGSADLLLIRVLTNEWLRQPFVGLTKEAVTAEIGNPEDVVHGVEWYPCRSCTQEEMSLGLEYDRGRVFAVSFRLYYD